MSDPSRALCSVIQAQAQIDWGAVFDAELPRVYNFFLYKTGNREIAQDLTAITFERAWKNRSRYHPGRAALATWLFGFTNNILKEHFRRNKKDKQRSESFEQIEIISKNHDVENDVLRHQEHDQLHMLLNELSEREQSLIALKYGAGLSNREIAKISGLSESNVGSILYRSVTALRDKWEARNER
jgi:RNA polymerase sigma-70 factor (ECF subfamily)